MAVRFCSFLHRCVSCASRRALSPAPYDLNCAVEPPYSSLTSTAPLSFLALRQAASPAPYTLHPGAITSFLSSSLLLCHFVRITFRLQNVKEGKSSRTKSSADAKSKLRCGLGLAHACLHVWPKHASPFLNSAPTYTEVVQPSYTRSSSIH